MSCPHVRVRVYLGHIVEYPLSVEQLTHLYCTNLQRAGHSFCPLSSEHTGCPPAVLTAGYKYRSATRLRGVGSPLAPRTASTSLGGEWRVATVCRTLANTQKGTAFATTAGDIRWDTDYPIEIILQPVACFTSYPYVCIRI